MLRISQLKLPITHTKEELEQKIRKVLRLSKTPSYTILRRSVDARKKPELFFQYSIDVEAEKEDQVYKQETGHADGKIRISFPNTGLSGERETGYHWCRTCRTVLLLYAGGSRF